MEKEDEVDRKRGGKKILQLKSLSEKSNFRVTAIFLLQNAVLFYI